MPAGRGARAASIPSPARLSITVADASAENLRRALFVRFYGQIQHIVVVHDSGRRGDVSFATLHVRIRPEVLDTAQAFTRANADVVRLTVHSDIR